MLIGGMLHRRHVDVVCCLRRFPFPLLPLSLLCVLVKVSVPLFLQLAFSILLLSWGKSAFDCRLNWFC